MSCSEEDREDFGLDDENSLLHGRLERFFIYLFPSLKKVHLSVT